MKAHAPSSLQPALCSSSTTAVVTRSFKQAEEGPDVVATFASLLQTCGNAKAGSRLHHHIVARGLDKNLLLGRLILQMYDSLGAIQDAHACFPSLHSCNVLIRAYVRHGHGQKALHLFDQLVQEAILPDKFSFVNVLSVCSKEKTLEKGKCLHALAVRMGLDSDVVMATAILNMYGKCGNLDDARKTFEELYERDVISWNAIIAACAQLGHGAECLQLFVDMHQKCVLPDKYTFVSILAACASLENLENGKHIHARLSSGGPRDEVTIDTALVNMYSKCCSLEHARRVFDEIPHQDMISWNAMISGYAQHGYAEDVFYLFHVMQWQGMVPNRITFVGIIDACATWRSLCEGQQMHSYLVEGGFEVDVVLGSALVNMYCKCGSLNDAFEIFHSLPERNLISWNSMIAGYVARQQEEEALKLFDTMQGEGVNPDRITCTVLLDACASLENLAEGERIYNIVVQNGLDSDSSVAASVVKLYGKCACVDDSYMIFKKLPLQNAMLWNAMLIVYSQHGLLTKACELFHRMHELGVLPESPILVDVLSSCASQAALPEGKWIHWNIILHAFDTNIFLVNALVNMYGKCGSLEDAWILFEGMPERNSVSWTTMIAAYTHCGHDRLAIQLFGLMQRENVSVDEVTFISILDACTSQEALPEGQIIHSGIVYRGLDLNVIVANALVNMYGKCGGFDNAKRVFENMANHDVVSWNTIISAYAQQSKLAEVLECFDQMKRERVIPDEVTFVSMLSACASLENIMEAKWVHKCVILCGFESRLAVASALTNMYGKCGMLEDAQRLFEKMLKPNSVAWNAMIMAYTEQGRNTEALQLFKQMHVEGVISEKAVYVCILNAYACQTMLIHGKQLHACIISAGFATDTIVATALVSMYGRCCSLEDASAIFYMMLERDVVSWNAMIGVFSEHQYDTEALQLFEQMLVGAVLPNSSTFVSILHACSGHVTLVDGKRMHARLLCSPSLLDSVIWNALLIMYGKCSSIGDAQGVFDEMPDRDLISWNVMIKIYAHAGHGWEALQMFFQMEVEGIIPDNITFISILDACGSLGAFSQGKSIHSCIRHTGFLYVIVNNALVNMYSKCGHLQDASEVFNQMPQRNVASWNAIISGHSQQGDGRKALELFDQMLTEVFPDKITFASVLCACTAEEALTEGKLIHNFIASSASEQEVLVGNALINMYGKCGDVEDAHRVFERIHEKNIATWNTIIIVDTLHGHVSESLHLIDDMQERGIIPNEVTFVSMLDSCGSLGAAEKGRLLHIHIIHCGIELDVAVATSLVNMYGKCGILEDALNVFKHLTKKDFITWTAMIAAYTCHGHGKEALLLLMQMQRKGLMVDRVTLVSILSACSHAGLLDEGQHYLFHMYEDQGSMAALEHLDCMIDLFGRMGQLKEAEDLINDIPFQPTLISWTGLLGACRNLGDIERANRVTWHIIELDPKNTAACIVLSNMHVAAEKVLTAKK